MVRPRSAIRGANRSNLLEMNHAEPNATDRFRSTKKCSTI
jgi:hypothetical protein